LEIKDRREFYSSAGVDRHRVLPRSRGKNTTGIIFCLPGQH